MKYETMDITTAERGVIAQGVNCQKAMGAGVALALMKKWPFIRECYMQHPGGHDALGSTHIILVEDGIHIANCYTQEFYGPGDKKYASVDAIEQSLDFAFSYAEYHNLPIYIPQIGCGLAGLDWEQDVEPIINGLDKHYETVDTTICIWG